MALLDDESRKHLLARARAAIAKAIGAEREIPVSDPIPNPQSPIPSPESPIPGDVRAGAFVTLRVHGQLRGCIGYPESSLPLIEVVERCAVSAAISDPRFPAVTMTEWSTIDLEVSVLGPIEAVRDISDVEVGKHGLIVELGHRRGLLLPQVATEWKWDAAEFAAQTCVKAGLPKNAWQDAAKLYRFEAEIFGESP
jgi:AmmeMemoRadiSam system protein A